MSTDSLSADSPFNWPYWVDHVRQPVRFADGIATLRAQPIDLFLEIGPKPTLISLARQCLEGGDEETERQGDKE
jgi:acyl transferase domain-containing protein